MTFPAARTLSQDNLVAEARDRFGDDPMAWAFECPNCGDVATGLDFREALAEWPRQRKDGTPMTASDLLGTECVGRTREAPRSVEPHYAGCNWAAYGLFRGPWTVTTADGTEIACFPLAERGWDQ